MKLKNIAPKLNPALLVVSVVALSAFIGGCSDDKDKTSFKEAQQTEDNQQRLSRVQPPPQFEYSLERENLIKRLKAWNVKNKVSYFYAISYGRVMWFDVVNGKLSSVNSSLTTPQQVIHPYSASEGHVVDSPDFDGSYGENPPNSVFFFTPAGKYREWSGDYLWTDEPIRLTEKPLMIYDVAAKSGAARR